jgi:predicted dehydrogenase
MARLVAEASGHPTPAVESLVAQAVIGPTGVDETAAAILRLPGGMLAQLAASLRQKLANRVVVHGEAGRLTVESPWYAGGFEGGESRMLLERTDMPLQEIRIIEPRPLWTIEADAVGHAIHAGLREFPELPYADTLATMRVLDAWRAAIGTGHSCETAGVQTKTR